MFWQTSIKWTVDPDKELQKLKTGLRNKAIRIAANAAGAPMKAAVIANAPQDQGFLVKAIRIKVKNYQNKAYWVVLIGATTAFKRIRKTKRKRRDNDGNIIKQFIKPSKYLHLVNSGTAFIRAREFMEASYTQAKSQFTETFNRKLAEQVQLLMKSK